MHDVGIMLAGENITGTSHICRKLKCLIKTAVYDCTAKARITKITNHKVIGFGLRVFRIFQVDTTDQNPSLFNRDTR